MLGLGVGVDYSLFIVTRYRALYDGGMESKEAVARAIATSGGAVVFAGGTVLISLLCLYFGDIPQVEQLGYSAAIAVFVVIVAALTLLPAGLSLLGRHINSLRVRTVPEEGGYDPDNPNGWARWARGVGRHPVISALAGIVVLVVLALPVFDISLGAQDNGQMPESTTIRNSYDALDDGFGVGANGPLLVAVDVKPPAQNDQQSLNQLQDQEQQQQQAEQQQIEQLTEQYEEEGVPADQAQQQATQQVEAQGPSQQQQEQTQQQEQFLSHRHRTRGW